MTRRLLLAACAVVLAASCSSSGSGAAGATSAPTDATGASGASSVTMISSTSLVPAAPRPTLKCDDQLGWPTNPTAGGYSVVLGKVSLPTGRAFAAVKQKHEPTRRKYWAKQGLLVRPRTSFELIVPAKWAPRVTIEWGNPGTPTTHLWVSNCAAIKRGAKWLAFAGGFKVNKPACVPLIVKAGEQRKTVHVGVGKACPGQAPRPK